MAGFARSSLLARSWTLCMPLPRILASWQIRRFRIIAPNISCDGRPGGSVALDRIVESIRLPTWFIP